MNQIPFRVLFVAFALLLAISSWSNGGEWPQILGPNRDARALDESLADAWPDNGPRVVWQHPVGEGYAGPAAVPQHLVLFHRIGDEEVVESLDPRTGERRWRQGFPTPSGGGIDADGGPRCVPLIHGDQVYLLGVTGILRCLGLADGHKIWGRSLKDEFRTQEGYFGIGSTPIVDSGRLIVNVGGRNGAGLAAFSPDDGRTIWTATDDDASYSSPTTAVIHGQRHVVFATRLHAVSIDPRDGAIRFRFPFGTPGATVTAATPLVFDDHVFYSAAYRAGAALVKVTREGAEVVWESDDIMSSQYATCVFHEGNLYGVDGREDVGRTTLRCFNPYTRKVHWSVPDFGMATVTLADKKLILLKTSGEIVLAMASPDSYRPIARSRIFNSTTRALPALADGLFYARDTEELKCFDLSD